MTTSLCLFSQFDCPLCAKQMVRREDFLFHVRAVHGIGAPVVCPHCFKRDFLSRNTFYRHKRNCRTAQMTPVKPSDVTVGSQQKTPVVRAPAVVMMDRNRLDHPVQDVPRQQRTPQLINIEAIYPISSPLRAPAAAVSPPNPPSTVP